MRNKKYILSLLLSVVLITGLAVNACEGPTGPEGPQGPKGEVGPQGEEGPAGESPVQLFAVVDNDHNGFVRVSGGTSFDEGAPNNGRVDIIFDRDISACTWIVSTGDVGPEYAGAPASSVRVEEIINGNTLRVVTFDPTTGDAAEYPFHLAVFCF